MSLDSGQSLNLDGSSYRFAIVAARFNGRLVDSLVRHASATLEAAGAPKPEIARVPGSAELPFATSLLAQSGAFDAIIAIGLVIAGDTNHHNVIGESTAISMHDLSIQTGLPIINGIIVVENPQQAEARAGTQINRGKEFAEAALEMAAFTEKWKTRTNP